MTNWIDIINFGISCGGFIVALLGFFFTFTTAYMDMNSRIFFRIFFVLLTLYIASDITSQISLVILGPDFAHLSKIAVFGESFFSSLLMPAMSLYLLLAAGDNPFKNVLFHIIHTLLAIYIILLIYTQFSTSIYYITAENVYNRGPYYPVLLVPPALLMLVNIIIYIQKRGNLSKYQRNAFAIYLVVPLVCMIIQMVSYGLLLIVIGSSLSAFFMFTTILSDQTEHYIKQSEEKLQAEANIKVLQMRPHFIYNTMTSIYYLCEQSPEKAMKTINDFTNYLRRNFSAIAKDGPIPFKEELEHVHTYLSIEQTRFEGNLFVEFDTSDTNFRIPPLTLQPLVENSVKYGVDPELDPLYIRVSSEETDLGHVITVTDTGPGFDMDEPFSTDDRNPHVAIANIKERLSMMCNGTLTISKRPEGGTEAVIFIPSDQQ